MNKARQALKKYLITLAILGFTILVILFGLRIIDILAHNP